MKLRLEFKVVAVLTLALAVILLLAAVSWSTMRELEEAVSSEQGYQTMAGLHELMSLVTDVETGQRGYVVTGDEAYLEPHRAALRGIPARLAALEKSLPDHPDLSGKFPELRRLVGERLAASERCVEVRRSGGEAAARGEMGHGKQLHDQIRAVVHGMELAQGRILAQRLSATREAERSTRLVLLLGVALGLIGLAGGLIAILRDVGGRRAAEQALDRLSALQRAILDGTDLAIISGDHSGITLFNRGAERLLGYRAEEVVGRATPVLFHDPEEMARQAGELSRELGEPVEPGLEVFLARARAGLPEEGDWTYLRKDGGRVPVHLSVSPMRDVRGTIFSFVGVARDITLQRLAESEARHYQEELVTARDRAQAADRVKSAFLATMSHELRTPLNSILGFTGILLQELAGPLNPEQRKQLELVRKNGRHLLDLINDVLDISKIEAGQLQTRSQPFNLRASLQKLVDLTRPLADRKGLELSLLLADDVGTLVSDPRRAEQIVLNLLTNAVKFTLRGRVTLTADMLGEPRTARIQVQDTGIGIQAGDLGTLFQPFHQLDTGISRAQEGTGLGLAISARLAAALGGDLEVESELGKGSTFTLRLPDRKGGP